MRAPRLLLAASALLLVTACGGSSSSPAAAPSPSPSASAALLSGQPLLDALREGGLVLYLRHTETTEGGVDAITSLGDCTKQRELSDAGRQDAREIGQAFATLEIPVGSVTASPFCRTTETATLAFGEDRVETDEGLLALASTGNAAETERLTQRAREVITAVPPAGQNSVLVGHVSNVGPITGISPDEGGTAVFRPVDGDVELVAEVGPQGWQVLARELG